jgi:hypothetical protein
LTPVTHDPFSEITADDEATRERREANFAEARTEAARQQIMDALAAEEKQAAEQKRSAFRETAIGRLLGGSP